MKKAYIRTRDNAEAADNSENESSESIAYDEALSTTEEITAASAETAKNGTGKLIREMRSRIQNRRRDVGTKAASDGEVHPENTSQSAVSPAAEVTHSQQRYETHYTEQGRAVAVKSAIKEKQTGTKAAPEQRILGRIKTREYVQRSTTASGAVTHTRSVHEAVSAQRTAEKTNAAAVKAANDSRKAAQFAKQAADKARKAAEEAERRLKSVIKGAIKAMKSLVAAISGGGAVAVIIIIVICLLGLIIASAFGIFAGNEVGKATGDTSRDLRAAVSEINTEYYERIQGIRSGVENLDKTTIRINGEVGAMTGVWQDVLSVYSVDTAHGENATLAIDFDASKKEKLRSIFWDMVSISYRVTERKVMEETPILEDAQGVSAVEMTEVIYHDVTINVTTKSAVKASELYSFTGEQNKVLSELMDEKFTKAWSDLIYGYSYGDEDIVAVAISQLGNVGGEPYWRWWGLRSRTAWCAIFVSWCADQCGYLDAGIIPKFAWVPDGVAWFQSRGQWQPRGYTPAPGDIIFFDWAHNGGMDHVGIVEYYENGIVHTIEGNTGDTCKRKQYNVNSPSILGYGIPMY